MQTNICVVYGQHVDFITHILIMIDRSSMRQLNVIFGPSKHRSV